MAFKCEMLLHFELKIENNTHGERNTYIYSVGVNREVNLLEFYALNFDIGEQKRIDFHRVMSIFTAIDIEHSKATHFPIYFLSFYFILFFVLFSSLIRWTSHRIVTKEEHKNRREML